MPKELIEGYRLSVEQKRLWSLQQNSAAYRAQCAITLSGNLNRAALTVALRAAVERHEILRTTFHQFYGMNIPLQAPSDEPRLSYQEFDLSHLDEVEQQDHIRGMLLSESQTPFDFERGPLARFALLALGGARSVLLVNLPALCADAWSLKNLIRDIGKSYDRRLGGQGVEPEPLQYIQFSEWQNELLEADDNDLTAENRRDHSAVEIPSLFLPFEKRGASGSFELESFAPESVSLAIDPEMVRTIKAFTGRYGVSIPCFLLACWQVMLWRLTRQPDFVVYNLFHGRRYEELLGALGLFSTYAPVRTRLGANPTFEDVLKAAAVELNELETRPAIAGAAENRDDLVGDIEPSKFPVGFDFEEWNCEQIASDLHISWHEHYVCTDRFKLRLSASLSQESLALELRYDPALYPADGVLRIGDGIKSLLKSATTRPELPIGLLDVVGERDRLDMLVNWNNTACEYPRNTTIHEVFEFQVERSPDAIAVVFGEEHLTYRELNRRANQLARRLARIGVAPESRVALQARRSLQLIVGVMGVLKSGAAYVPLDPAQPKERLRLMLQEMKADVLLTEQSLIMDLAEREPQILCLDRDWETISQESDQNLSGKATPDNLAYVIYTSGSTGSPKGTMIRHESVLNLAMALDRAIWARWDSLVRMSLNAPLAFDSSVKQILGLLKGRALELIPEEIRSDGPALLAFLKTRGLEVFDCTPSQLRLLLDAGLAELSDSPLAMALIGGEALDTNTWSRLIECDAVAFYNVYGPTECTVDATACRIDPLLPEPTIGRPLANTRIYLVDEKMELPPIGLPGELYVSGAGVARGYFGRPDLTAQVFAPDPFSVAPGGRLYRTGDLACYRLDGNIEFLGRIDHQVKVRGFRVEMGEIERALLRHPKVFEAVVMARENEPGDQRLTAYIVADNTSAPSVSELRESLETRLPEYMRPSAYVFLDALPLTSNGKIDRRALPAPDQVRTEMSKGFAPPQDPIELQMVHIWESILETRPIGIKDDFFELGGHSLLAVRLMAQIEKRFGQTLPLATLFQNPTIDHLARNLRRESRSALNSPLVSIQPAGTRPPFFCVHPIGGDVFCYVHLARHLGPDQPFYGLADVLGLDSDEDPYISFEDLAAFYVEAIRGVQPEGPYLIGGWSYGGVVAFAMAQRLCSQGERVALLGLMDCMPLLTLSFGNVTDIELLVLTAQQLARQSGSDLSISLEEIERFDGEQQWAWALAQLQGCGVLPREIEVQHLRRYIRRQRARGEARERYVLRGYPGEITLFRASDVRSDLLVNEETFSDFHEKFNSAFLDPVYGWDQYSSRPIRRHTVEGHHLSMVTEPHVRSLAEQLRACIDRAVEEAQTI